MRTIGSYFVVRGLATAAAVALSPTAGAQTWALERDAADAYLDGVAMADLGLAGPEYSYVTVQHAVAVAVELRIAIAPAGRRG